MKKSDLKSHIKSQMTQNRWEHTVRVTETAIQLANLYEESVEKVEIAALFHDYAKCWTSDALKDYLVDHQICTDVLNFNKELWHAPVASHLIQQKFGIKDTHILDAIRYHTTGRPNMSKLELIVFVADYIEPGRLFSGVDEVRQAARKDLNYAAWIALCNTIEFLCKKRATIYPDTFHAYNDLTKKMGEKN
ncbi:bis(5'-nucleosyl)-tetraphosphatase (symmetrical) YqeK [Virgibacillus sp. W0430]|uniref:bis(5'-nucleosyl)-tetraphosphatase (symmetrical) YqeK n=1 Tax=Virgibacillus sp. W0430 TaxID=3391580 RepID=UPI003F452FEC